MPSAEETASLGETLLDKYRVERVLGEGGMGVVLAARHIDLGQLFAIKLLRRGTSSNASTVSRFMREARAAARLTNDHVARVYDVGRLDNGAPYMVMEYLEGSDLSQVVCSRGALPLDEVVVLVQQACDAIAEAHTLGIVHRDLKLANLFLTRRRSGEPFLKVLDFGISKQPEDAEQLTKPGAIVGSPRYMSPEQISDPKTVDGRSDIWAMGVILHELTTGKPPFEGKGLPELIMNVFSSVPPPPSRLRPELPTALDEVVARCLCKHRDGRYATIAEFAAAVGSIVGARGEQPRSGATQGGATLKDTSTLEVQHEPPLTPTPREGTGERSKALPEPRVFISCRGDVAEDVEVALSFYDALVAAGVSPFLGPKSILENDNWVRAVSQALRGCDAFLLLLSAKAAVSEMVAAELDLARQLREGQAGRPHIVPVRIGVAEGASQGHPLQERLQDLEGIGWGSPEDTPAVVRFLLEKIGRRDLARCRPVREARGSTVVAPRSTPRSTEDVPLELPGGVVSAQSPYYVVRPSIEEACLREIKRDGALVRIKGPRQMGKTSLMARLLGHAARTGARTVSINLQMADGAIVGDLNRFLRWLCAVVTRRLKLPSARIDDAWDDIFGAKDNCTAYFEEHLLPEGEPLVLALDNVDRIFVSPGTAEELLALLRAWHEMSKSQEPWRNLRLVLAYSTEMYLPMNINRSPFNVGLPVALSEWDAGIVHGIARRHGLAWGASEVERLMSLLGGHPHLVRIALYHIAQGMSLSDVLATAATDQGLFADHLKHLLWQLQRQPELHEAARRVMAAAEPVRLRTELGFKLVSLGLVRLEGNEVRPAREIYRRYLSERLSADAER
ncbi:AAA-like domain-containing protein [Sorangium sp. So ce131]|uniref:AAA-like domain-containing protein n=1 Tax=Sorangium sp. So ce131 TaxID=3133282 RepID=UPI003F608FDC